LTEAPTDAVPLVEWLSARVPEPLWTAQRKQRWRLVREVGRVLRALHAARCYRSRRRPCWPLVVGSAGLTPAVAVDSVAHAVSFRKPSRRHAVRDLLALRRSLPDALGTRTDVLRFLLAYFDLPRLPASARGLARRLLAERRRGVPPGPALPSRLLQLSYAFFGPLGRTATGAPPVGRTAP
jgi:hypothetical protein